jgi:hypothetical protein
LNSSVSAAPLPHWKPGKLGLVAIRTRRAITLMPVALFPFLCVANSTAILNKQCFGLIFIKWVQDFGLPWSSLSGLSGSRTGFSMTKIIFFHYGLNYIYSLASLEGSLISQEKLSDLQRELLALQNIEVFLFFPLLYFEAVLTSWIRIHMF